MNYTPFIYPSVCDWTPAPIMPPVAPVKPQHTPYILPPFMPERRIVCAGNYGCALEAPPLENSMLLNDGWPEAVLPQIWQRGPPGPWQRIGYVVSTHEDTKDKTMPLYAKKIQFRSNRYDYRVTDTNGVAIEVATNVRWLNDGERVKVDGREHPYTIRVYSEYN